MKLLSCSPLLLCVHLLLRSSFSLSALCMFSGRFCKVCHRFLALLIHLFLVGFQYLSVVNIVSILLFLLICFFLPVASFMYDTTTLFLLLSSFLRPLDNVFFDHLFMRPFIKNAVMILCFLRFIFIVCESVSSV